MHLPLPGKIPPWPKSLFGHWRLRPISEAAAWLDAHRVWRREHLVRTGHDDAEYRRPELAWSQRDFVQTLTMLEDRYLYDPDAGRYTVDRYLDDLVKRYGGVDSVLLWWSYPNIGIDGRNQIDLAHDLPGGLEALREAVAAFHARDVRVFVTTMPWDRGTRAGELPDHDAIAQLAVAIGADGINGDTYSSLPPCFAEAAERAGRPLVLQPEVSTAVDESLRWNIESWGKASTEIIPAVSKLKWLEPRHMVKVENRWARDRTDDFHYTFFNGIGYVAWENVWGIWNGFTPRDAATLRRLSTIQRRLAELFASTDWAPYATTLQADVFASLFPGADRAVWTVVNRNEYGLEGEQLAVLHRAGRRYFDLWHGVPLQPRIDGEVATLSFAVERRGYGCVYALDADAPAGALDEMLAEARVLAAQPLIELSAQWHPLPQRLVEAPLPQAAGPSPSGMSMIPAGEFLFRVAGVMIEGGTAAGVDVQYPWERSPRRSHHHRLRLDSFAIDRHPVTNEQFAEFLAASGWRPRDRQNFLRHWVDGKPPVGWERKPVTWVSLDDARAYAAWAGKRLPHEWEWQYAAQGGDGRPYPWGSTWDDTMVAPRSSGAEPPAPPDVGCRPGACSPFGVEDLVGCVWEWTDEYEDEHTRAAVLRGGSAWTPRHSHWYFPQALRLDQHGKRLLMAPARDRAATIGFRCVSATARAGTAVEAPSSAG